MASSLLFMINIFIFFFFFHCFSVSSSTSSVCRFPLIDGAEVNGMFVFGSSLVDTGNNNFVEGATARSDYLPYGIDYPTGPSGRFSNGKNLIDGLSELLKIPFTIPPFNHPSYTKGYRIIHGVDFASGGSGILNETGSLSGRVMNFNEQIKNFEEEIRPQLEAQLCISWNGTSGGGGGSVISSTQSSRLVTFETILSDYLFVLGVGGNDYLLNYFIWPTSKYKFMCLQKFTDTLISSFSTKIKKLYSLGGRKFVLVSIYPLGCIPAVKSLFGVLKSNSDCRGCFPLFNKAARLYNTRLKSLVDELKTKLPGANLVYINTYQTIYDIIKDPASQGFKDASNACCEVPSILEGGNGISCKKGGSSCEDRKSHLFFDGLHPTEAVNVLLANKAYYSSNQSDAYPFNVQYLANSC